jgi:hypothetical protein
VVKIKRSSGSGKGYMLIKQTKKGITVMPAINPDGTPSKPPRGFKRVPVTIKWFSITMS